MSFLDRLAEHRRTLASEFIPVYEATKFVRYMEQEHPEELWEWLRTHAVTFCAKALNDMLRRERQLVTKRASARAFAIAAANGLDDMHPFQLVYAVDTHNTRRQVGEMTGADHLFVANRYDDSGLRLLFLSDFHRAVARRIGSEKTSAVISESEYVMMLNSVLGRPPGDLPLSPSPTPPISI